MPSTYEVGKKLVDLCRQGKHMEAITTLYATNIVAIEAMAGPNMPHAWKALMPLRRRRYGERSHEIHGGNVDGPAAR